jgi:hypothetical protein
MLLTACGGGGGGGGGFPMIAPPAAVAPPAEVPEPAPGPEADPMAITPYTYQLGTQDISDPKALLAELHSTRMSGFLIYLSFGIHDLFKGEQRALYQKKGNAAGYEHRIRPMNEARTLPSMQSQGAEGYRITGDQFTETEFNAILSKATDSTTTYEFVDTGMVLGLDGIPSNLLTTFNKLGQQGYCAFDSIYPDGKLVLGREVPTSARCVFELVPTRSEASHRENVEQLNAQGAKGAKFVTGLSSSGEPKNLFVRDETQRSTFSYRIVDTSSFEAPTAIESAMKAVALFNQEGESGAKPYRVFSDPGGRPYTVFMTARGCKGLLC